MKKDTLYYARLHATPGWIPIGESALKVFRQGTVSKLMRLKFLDRRHIEFVYGYRFVNPKLVTEKFVRRLGKKLKDRHYFTGREYQISEEDRVKLYRKAVGAVEIPKRLKEIS